MSVPGRDYHTNIILQEPAILGRDITTSIIHSVQLTPVVDIYRAQEGNIWAWQEKIRSHSAGLPSLKPERGRFLFDPPWMIVEGGGAYWEQIFYRVGNEEFGKNTLCVFMRPCMELWRQVTGKRLIFRSMAGNKRSLLRRKLQKGSFFTP